MGKNTRMASSPELMSPNSTGSRRSVYESPQARHKKLREMLDRTSMLQENATVACLDVLAETVEEVENIHLDIDDKIVNQDQILLDSQVMKASSQVIRGAMQSLDQETNSYSATDFASKLLKYVRNLADDTVQEPNWELLGREVAAFIKPCGSSSTLLHCMEPIPKSEVQPKKPKFINRTRDVLLPAKKPEKVVAIANDDNPVDKSVDKIAHLTKKYYKRNKEPLNFFKLIVNPHDFGKTVENMLHVAFLVRDGRMELLVGEDDDLLIQPVPKEVLEEQEAHGNLSRIANIPTLNMEIWKLLIEALDITEPMINFE
ncbi:EP300-interacting inhibitor of differentiation 3 [Diachasma alloeum]|uniref:EP300-interacting inhibitor of differentiation 3 n=1 Tax=Diachasma alloeum TaxID=454923 RepID=UPI0007382A62|nr:EP300-interacting inhibitor of differentiation 3 [Diachasma alloeum]XP_015111558.1 EP300-interacting inhibitor of differentiation 3 [Diachasma alloeum]XP_015111559.1 EP300-interacting inhibitor of differentiation 3 [Diachasma alloeum]XP_015111560.1 EP300-interacting inhibitor of differentiation 3 [Diachasma alloeum]